MAKIACECEQHPGADKWSSSHWGGGGQSHLLSVHVWKDAGDDATSKQIMSSCCTLADFTNIMRTKLSYTFRSYTFSNYACLAHIY